MIQARMNGAAPAASSRKRMMLCASQPEAVDFPVIPARWPSGLLDSYQGKNTEIASSAPPTIAIHSPRDRFPGFTPATLYGPPMSVTSELIAGDEGFHAPGPEAQWSDSLYF